MAEFVKIAQLNQLSPGNAMTVQAKGQAIALYNVGGKVFATSNTCAHKGGPLGDGSLEGNHITCPLHGYEYDVTNGHCVTMPAMHIQPYKTKIEGNDIFVEM